MTTPSFQQHFAPSIAAFTPLTQGKTLICDNIGWRANSIKTVKNAFGGLGAFTFVLNVGDREAESWLTDGLARHIEVRSPGLSLIWDGYASMIDANLGPLTKTMGPLFDVVANKVRVVYSTIDTSTSPPTLGVREATAWLEDATSQAQYGIIEQVKSVGGSNATLAAQIGQTVLADKAQPEAKEADSLSGGGGPSVTVTVRGYMDWLKAYTYQSATTGTQAVDVKLKAILDQDPNGIFSADQSAIVGNPNTLVGAWEQDYDNVAYNLVKGLVALGDDNFVRYLFGLDVGRKPFYRAMPTLPLYQRTRSAPRQEVQFYGTGARVYPWNVKAGEWVFYTDVQTARPPTKVVNRNDQRFLFTERVDWQAPWNLKLNGAQVNTSQQLLAQLGLGGSA